jgi:hypothetical protein
MIMMADLRQFWEVQIIRVVAGRCFGGFLLSMSSWLRVAGRPVDWGKV